MIQRGTLSTPYGELLCRHRQVVDVAAAQQNIAMSPHPSSYLCPFCTCPTKDHCKINAPTYPARTLDQCLLYSHTRTGFCPACQKHIVTQQEYDDEIAASNVHPYPKARDMVVVAEVGDPAPPWYKSSGHLGYTYGGHWILAIEPVDTAACWMHADSCLVGMMFSCSVLQQLTVFHSSGKEPICQKIFNDLKKCNLKMPKLVKVSDTIGEYFNSLRSFKCTGRATKVLCLVHAKLLQYVFPEELQARDPEARNRYKNFTAMWDYYIENIVPLINDTAMSRADKADLLELRAKEFIVVYVKAHKETAHLYPHILARHMPPQYRSFGLDLKDTQLQSTEHTNKDVKFKQSQCTNRKQSHNETENVDAYKRTSKSGKEHWVGAHTRNSGPCRMTQVAQLKLVSHATDDNSVQRSCESQSRLNSAKKMKFEKNVLSKLPIAFNLE